MAEKISSETVRGDFNDPIAVVHYARAAHFLGLWKSETVLIERFFTDKKARLLEAGCGAGRVSVAMWDMGYRDLTAFDFAEELLDQARCLATERGATGVKFFHADATRLGERDDKRSSSSEDNGLTQGGFEGALFMFNGLMQIPGRANRRRALQGLASLCRQGAPFLFTTHDRNSSRTEQALWKLETVRWEQGRQDARLVEFGDRYFEDDAGRVFMHLPDRQEILEDLQATGWTHHYDELRKRLCKESKAVEDFSDECRFWCALRS